MKIINNSVVLALALTTIFGCSPESKDTNPTPETNIINIGFLGDYSGPVVTLTPSIEAGARLAIAHINSTAGFATNTELVLKTADTGCTDLNKSRAAARSLIDTDNVIGLVGALCSVASKAIAENELSSTNTPMVSPSSTSPALSDMTDNQLFYRVVPSDQAVGRATGHFLDDSSSVALVTLARDNDYSNVYLAGVNETYSGVVSQAITIATGDTNETLKNALSGHADKTLLYIENSPDTNAENLLHDILTDNLAMEVFVNDKFYDYIQSAQLENTLKAKLNVVVTKAYSNDIVLYNVDGSVAVDQDDPYFKEAYDATMVLSLALFEQSLNGGLSFKTAIENVTNTSGQSVLADEWSTAVEALGLSLPINYNGVTNAIEFNDDGDVSAEFESLNYSEGSWQTEFSRTVY